MSDEIAALFPSEFFDSEFGRIPKGWRVGSLLTIADLMSGGTPKTDRAEYWDGLIPWASAKDVSQCPGVFLTSSERKITERGLHQSATKMIPKFSTVIVARGATTGRMVLLGEPMAMNQTCYALATSEGTPFALNALMNHSVTSLVHAAHGSVFDTITTATFRSRSFLLPPVELMRCYDEIARPLYMQVLEGTLTSQTLSALRDLLLPRLISGELRVPDAARMVGDAIE